MKKLSRNNILGKEIAQILISIASCLLIFVLGREVSDGLVWGFRREGAFSFGHLFLSFLGYALVVSWLQLVYLILAYLLHKFRILYVDNVWHYLLALVLFDILLFFIFHGFSSSNILIVIIMLMLLKSILIIVLRKHLKWH